MDGQARAENRSVVTARAGIRSIDGRVDAGIEVATFYEKLDFVPRQRDITDSLDNNALIDELNLVVPCGTRFAGKIATIVISALKSEPRNEFILRMLFKPDAGVINYVVVARQFGCHRAETDLPAGLRIVGI